MKKHLITLLVILIVCLSGYGLWLYSESLRTHKNFNLLLKQDLTAKQEALTKLLNKNRK